ncbi:MAG: hypothetical protein CENE_02325 [Candidatus Celerinatantimonas neptuna]|nr:MAG: hypothetical protein CENE_02325 [Candidatus Celerinatantimonas neptuna]
MVDNETAKLIDANMTRPGGTNVTEMITHSFGIELADFFTDVISISIFGKPVLDPDYFNTEDTRETVGILYGQPKDAKLLRIESSGLESSHHIAANMGFIVPKIGESNWSIIGSLTGTQEQIQRDLNRIHLVTDQGTYPPSC